MAETETRDVPMVDAEEPKLPEDILGNGGILKTVIKEGTGWQKPKAGAEVRVHYVGRLIDGSIFDSSRERNSEFTFKLGKGQVIKGWDEGVAAMKKGELAKLTIKPEYAYGSRGSPPKIPADATLEFEVELISWSDETDITKDGGVLKKVVKEGEGWERPKEGSTVTINYTARVFGEGNVALDREFEPASLPVIEQRQGATFVLGEDQLIEGLDKTLAEMKKGEIAEVKIRPKYAYGRTAAVQIAPPATGGATPDTTLFYEVELVEFTKEKESWDMETPEKLEVASKKREQGNELFRVGKVRLAVKRYKRALDYVQYDSGFSEAEKEKSKAVKLPCYLNLAACYVKLGDWKEVITQSDKALEIDAKNVKALFRRGKARLAFAEFEEARRDLAQALEIDPQNKEVAAELAALKAKVREQNQKEKKIFSNMFERMSKLEEKEKKAQPKLEEEATPASTTTTTTATTPAEEGKKAEAVASGEPMEVQAPSS